MVETQTIKRSALKERIKQLSDQIRKIDVFEVLLNYFLVLAVLVD